MQNLLPCGQKEHSARTITGAVTGLQPSLRRFVIPDAESKNAIDFPLARDPLPGTAHWLQIFPPNQTMPIYLHFTSTACAKQVKAADGQRRGPRFGRLRQAHRCAALAASV